MSEDISDFGEDGGGYDADDWSRLTPFNGRIATLDDVQAKAAVFALSDTADPRVITMDLPQPLIWWEADGEQAAVAVQAESHLGPDGDEMDVLGLILPDGSAVVALLEDCDLVDDTDPVWRRLVEEAVGEEDATD